MVDGKERKFKAIRNADLVVNVAQVVLDDLLCRSELSGDLLVLVALHDQRNDT
jgi:hypothetical protein